MKRDTTRYPPITENVYSRFNDDGWGIRDIRRTKRSKELLDKIKKEEQQREDVQREEGGSEK